MSTGIYGKPTDQAASSLSSLYATGGASASSAAHAAASSVSSLAGYASAKATAAMDDTQDWVFSTWDDNKMR